MFQFLRGKKKKDMDYTTGSPDNYKGTFWQCIADFGGNKGGDMLKVGDVSHKNNSLFFMFDNGTKLNVEMMEQFIMQIDEGMYNLWASSPKANDKYNGMIDARMKIDEPIKHHARQQDPIQPQQVTVHVKANTFESMNIQGMPRHVRVKVMLPDVKLLRMMYKQSNDKDSFVSELADYIKSGIDTDALKECALGILDANQKNQDAK